MIRYFCPNVIIISALHYWITDISTSNMEYTALTKELIKVISGLVNKLVGKNKDVEIKDEPPKKVESKPKNVTEKKSSSGKTYKLYHFNH